ncbi:Dynein light chain Tctex-type [Hondaea fermentalgiana]|uniref:Dynein light chain Tctex-type n=1 Tax=Hondaea fermentalgiana TaxID=2315210 RepID=A0A2R5GKR9_9STRA|nr:Dynein light chain Tctex-type [Hondaea fermentalgiana]|eukprot:GBG31477.1 Dynein light chain Tctex-type [Hondaea fermentalgiana]
MPRRHDADEIVVLADEGDEDLASEGLLQADEGDGGSDEGKVDVDPINDDAEGKTPETRGMRRNSRDVEMNHDVDDDDGHANDDRKEDDDEDEDEEAKCALRGRTSRHHSSRPEAESFGDVRGATRFVDVVNVAQSIAERSISEHLEGRSFRSATVPRWVEAINQQCVQDLSAACNNLKYIASTVVYEASRGAGMEVASSMFWNAQADDSVTVSWENGSVGCIVTVFGVSY